MSSHLRTMIVVGPIKLKPSKTRVARVLKAAKEKQREILKAVEEGDDLDLGGGYLSREELEDVAALKPSTALKDLLNLWDGKGDQHTYFDVNSREARVKGARIRIMVAGDTSYGDEPEGDGFRVLLAAERLGMFPLLGLG